MNSADIKSMVEHLSDDTKELVIRGLKNEFSNAIHLVNNKLKGDNTPKDQLTPPPPLLLNAFNLCPVHKIKVIIMGQDPYIKPGEAMGLSFSLPKDYPIAPSLKKIYECLKYYGLVRAIPIHGDLSTWAVQGILLLNTSLTTVLRKSNAHVDCWSNYTDALLRELSKLPQSIIFILLGEFARKKSELIDKRRHNILEWGHPSPLNTANRTDNPANFKYCNAFARTNDLLLSRGVVPIDWNSINDTSPGIVAPQNNEQAQLCIDYKIYEAAELDPAPLTIDKLWIFTDGGTKGNGKKHCSASWAFYMTDGCTCASSSGIVPHQDIPGKIYKSSNNRGELTAIYYALHTVSMAQNKFSFSDIILVSDSRYSIDTLDDWIIKWLKDPIGRDLESKKNLDIIIPAKKLIDNIRAARTFNFQHVRSHMKEPADQESDEWFLWKCNDIVDTMCNRALGR